MLSPDQIKSFKADGYLILPSAISSEQIQEWRDQFWAHLDCTIDEPENGRKKSKISSRIRSSGTYRNCSRLPGKWVAAISRGVVVVWRCVGRKQGKSGRCRNLGI